MLDPTAVPRKALGLGASAVRGGFATEERQAINEAFSTCVAGVLRVGID